MEAILRAEKDLILKIMTFYMKHAERVVDGCCSVVKECHIEKQAIEIVRIKEINYE